MCFLVLHNTNHHTVECWTQLFFSSVLYCFVEFLKSRPNSHMWCCDVMSLFCSLKSVKSFFFLLKLSWMNNQTIIEKIILNELWIYFFLIFICYFNYVLNYYKYERKMLKEFIFYFVIVVIVHERHERHQYLLFVIKFVVFLFMNICLACALPILFDLIII